MPSESIRVAADSQTYDVVFDNLARIADRLRSIGLSGDLCFVVTDVNVGGLYQDVVREALDAARVDSVFVTVPPGEASKSSEQLYRLYDAFLEHRLDRNTPTLALGGGVVGDLAGYFAATILRGVPLVHLPTTLVAQVDSSIGGKTGINHSKGKNLIGSFHQPRLVLTDIRCLTTLPEREWMAGLSEMAKHALIDGEKHVRQLTESWGDVMNRSLTTLERVIPRSVRVKAWIVERDTRERGVRAHLNLGHTVGHAIEKVAGYGRVLHGEAVAAGLAIALDISETRFSADRLQLARNLLSKLPLPSLKDISFSQIADAMTADKKRLGGRIRFVLLARPGEAVVVEDVSYSEIEQAWNRLVQRSAATSRH